MGMGVAKEQGGDDGLFGGSLGRQLGGHREARVVQVHDHVFGHGVELCAGEETCSSFGTSRWGDAGLRSTLGSNAGPGLLPFFARDVPAYVGGGRGGKGMAKTAPRLGPTRDRPMR